MQNGEAGKTVVSRAIEPEDEKRWYVLRVRSRHEKKVFAELEMKRITASLPLMRITRQWSDRRKEVDLPLFRGYVFAKISLKIDRYTALQTPGVVQFVGMQGHLIAIPNDQMYWLDRILDNKVVNSCLEYPRGTLVKVVHGPLRGLEGTIVKKKSSSRLVVWFDAIMQGLAIDIAPDILKPLTKKQSAETVAPR